MPLGQERSGPHQHSDVQVSTFHELSVSNGKARHSHPSSEPPGYESTDLLQTSCYAAGLHGPFVRKPPVSANPQDS